MNGIAYLYYPIYLFVVFLATFFYTNSYQVNNGMLTNSGKQGRGLLVLLFLIIFIGTRPVNYIFTDMLQTKALFDYYEGSHFSFDLETENIIYDNLVAYFACTRLGYQWFSICMAIIYFVCPYIACRKLFGNNTIIGYLIWLAAFSTFAYATNGVKAGTGSSIFLLALAYKDKLIFCIPLMLLSIGFHHSMKVVVAGCVLAYFYRKTSHYYGGWVVCFLLAAAGVSYFMQIFTSYTDDQGQRYLSNEVGNNVTGFRPDFILYSFVPIALSYWIIVKQGFRDKYYEFLVRTYIAMNGVWLLCTYADYIDRIAYLSWFMYSFLLSYPLLRMNLGEFKVRYWKRIVYYHLLFTIFMAIYVAIR